MFKFAQHGESRAWVSELMPHTTKIVDELCFIKSMHTNAINHDPGITFFQTGAQLAGRPSMGAWLSYGLGSMNRDLPTFVAMVSIGTGQSGQPLYDRLWGSGFLPSRYQGVKFPVAVADNFKRFETEQACDTGTSGGLTVNANLHADLGLEGKVAIVGGGGAAGDGIGNGRAAAILLARAGARVLVVDRSLDLAEGTVRMIASEGGEAASHEADLTDEGQCAAMVEARSPGSGGSMSSTTTLASRVSIRRSPRRRASGKG